VSSLLATIQGCAAPIGIRSSVPFTDGLHHRFHPGCFDDWIRRVNAGKDEAALWVDHEPASNIGRIVRARMLEDWLQFDAHVYESRFAMRILDEILSRERSANPVGCSLGSRTLLHNPRISTFLGERTEEEYGIGRMSEISLCVYGPARMPRTSANVTHFRYWG
jgi:hypothetical protein